MPPCVAQRLTKSANVMFLWSRAIIMVRQLPAHVTVDLEASFLGQLFISRTISQPWALSSDIPKVFYLLIIPEFDFIWKWMLRIKFFAEAKFRRQKNGWNEQIRWAIYRRNTRNCGRCRPSNNDKKNKVRDEIIFWYISVKFPLKVGKFQIWPSTFYASWILRNQQQQQQQHATTFTFMLQNLLVLVGPNFRNR